MSGQEKNELEKVKEELTGIKEILTKLNDAILGNEYNQNSSYKIRLEKLEDFAEEQKLRNKEQKIWFTVFGAIGSGCAVVVFAVIDHWNAFIEIFSHK